MAKDLNPKIWTFLSASSLETDARWQTYRIAEPRKLRISSGVAGGERIVASWLLCLMHTKLFIIPVLYILVRELLPMKLKPELVESQELVEKSA